MRPQLEALENRELLDAAFALAFEVQVVPIMMQQRSVYDATLATQANKLLEVAEAQIVLFGLQNNPQALQSLQTLQVSLQDAVDHADTYFMANVSKTYDSILAFPSFPGEPDAINVLAQLYLFESPLPTQ